MYIRNTADALDVLAQILDLPDRRAQIVQTTIKIMLCLDAEPRYFLADCQALLIEGGLDALRRKRRDQLETQETIPIIVLDPEGDRLFEAAAGALDALRLVDVVRQVFPDLRLERWLVARALLARESDVQGHLSAAIKARGDREAARAARAGVEALVRAQVPAWADRAGTLRSACLDVLRGAQMADPDAIHEEAERLFELFAVSDARARELLAALDGDPEQAVQQIGRLYESLDAVRSLGDEQARQRREAA